MRYGLIESMRRGYPVALMCRVLNVSESGFHAQRTRPLCKRKQENTRLEIEILAAHQRTRETYSAKRLHHDLVGSRSTSHAIPRSNIAQEIGFAL